MKKNNDKLINNKYKIKDFITIFSLGFLSLSYLIKREYPSDSNLIISYLFEIGCVSVISSLIDSSISNYNIYDKNNIENTKEDEIKKFWEIYDSNPELRKQINDELYAELLKEVNNKYFDDKDNDKVKKKQ